MTCVFSPNEVEAGSIFVAGCPRSGNTMLGELLGSTSRVGYLGEYYAFSAVFHHVPQLLASARSKYSSSFIEHANQAAFTSASKAAFGLGKRHFCDSTPWNLLVMEEILAFDHKAVAVVPVRHFSGTLLSMDDSFHRGYKWIGDTWEKRARLWAELNLHATRLRSDRVIVVSYDRLCEEPKQSLVKLVESLSHTWYTINDFDPRILTCRYATYAGDHRHGLFNAGALTPIASLDSIRWSEEIAEIVWPIVRDADSALTEWSKGLYKSPSCLGDCRK